MRVILTVDPPPFAGVGPRERRPLLSVISSLIKTMSGNELRAVMLGHPLLDDYLEFVAARARPNTLLAAAYDLKVFFTEVVKQPAEVTTADVLGFIKSQRAPRRGRGVVRLEDGEAGLSARTIKRRLASVSGLFDYLVARGDSGVATNPVPRGLATRGRRSRPGVRGVPLIRAPRTLPRVLEPADVEAFLAALRTHRDRAMAQAMLLGGLRRCEVLGLRLPDLRPGERRVFVAEGKGGRQRIVPVSARVLLHRRCLLRHRTPTNLRHRPGLRRAEGATAGPAALGRRAGRDRRRGQETGRPGALDVPPAPSHLFHQAA